MQNFSRFVLSGLAAAGLCVAQQPSRDVIKQMVHRDAAKRGTYSVAPDPAGTTVQSEYRIGIGDVLQISIWGEPDASVASAVVRADGNVSLPLVKDVVIADLTPREAEKSITAKLEPYLHGADVTVIVREVHSRKAYIVGSVRTVGQVQMTGKMTVLQAITQAGGLTDYAKKKNIYVLRTSNGKQTKLPFNYDAVIKGEAVDQNILILPNDTIVVP